MSFEEPRSHSSILAPFEDIFLTKAAEGGERPCSTRASGEAAIILGITVTVASDDYSILNTKIVHTNFILISRLVEASTSTSSMYCLLFHNFCKKDRT